MAEEWLSPTDHNDPDNAWANEPYAYNEDTAYPPATAPTTKYTYSKWLELLIESIQCSKFRFWAHYNGYWSKCMVDLYYNDAWHNHFDGNPNNLAWTEVELGDTYQVTKARFSQYRSGGTGNAELYEFDFWGTTAPPPPEIETQDATGIKSDEAMLHTKILDDKGKTLSVRHNYGKTIAYGMNTPWQEGKHTNDVISQKITDLDPETDYHFRGEAVYED